MHINPQMHQKETKHSVPEYDAIDLMKFFGALMVVIIHTKPFQPYSNLLNVYTAEGVCRVAVPFFFSVSGLFLCQKFEGAADKAQLVRICIHQAARNFLMYFLWSTVYGIIQILHTGYFSLSTLITQIRLFFCDASVYHFWYLTALIYGIPCLGACYQWNRKCLTVLCAALWTYRCLWFSYRWLPGGNSIPWVTTYWESLRNALTGAVPMMIVGSFCWQDHRKKASRQWKKRTLICFALNMTELTLLYLLSPQKNHFEYLFTMPVLTYCFVNWLLTQKLRFQNRQVPRLLRKSSVWIYCSHVVFIIIFGWFHSSLGIRRFVVVTGCLIISTVFYLLWDSCFTRRFRRKGL